MKRGSVCRVWWSPGPAAQWPRYANHLGTPPGECFLPASHSTARPGLAATRHWRTTGMNTSISWVGEAEKSGRGGLIKKLRLITKGNYMLYVKVYKNWRPNLKNEKKLFFAWTTRVPPCINNHFLIESRHVLRYYWVSSLNRCYSIFFQRQRNIKNISI